MVTVGHGCDITPLLTSLASSKHLDICATEGVVVARVIITNLTDASGSAAAVGNFAIDLVVPP